MLRVADTTDDIRHAQWCIVAARVRAIYGDKWNWSVNHADVVSKHEAGQIVIMHKRIGSQWMLVAQKTGEAWRRMQRKTV